MDHANRERRQLRGFIQFIGHLKPSECPWAVQTTLRTPLARGSLSECSSVTNTLKNIEHPKPNPSRCPKYPLGFGKKPSNVNDVCRQKKITRNCRPGGLCCASVPAPICSCQAARGRRCLSITRSPTEVSTGFSQDSRRLVRPPKKKRTQRDVRVWKRGSGGRNKKNPERPLVPHRSSSREVRTRVPFFCSLF